MKARPRARPSDEIPASLGDVLERAFSVVAIERDAAIDADGEIGLAVVVVIADGAAHAIAADFEFRGFGDVLRICRRR